MESVMLAQEPGNESIKLPETDTVYDIKNVNLYPSDSISADTLLVKQKRKKSTSLDAEVKYSSKDSMIFSIGEKKLFLYKTAKVNYGEIELTADYVEFDMSDKTVLATGVKDSAGVDVGKPVFTQGSETFESDALRYNFESKKGLISHVVTQQGEGFLHSDLTKRMENGHVHVQGGKYTTCDAEHPHFYLGFTKAISIPEDKIVTGPSYMVLADVPLPIGLPFGFFPNTNTRASGLIFPTYGEEQARGFYLRNGGWYFPLGPYVDLRILADVYSLGSWGGTLQSNYKRRYKFNGNFNFRYYNNQVSSNPNYPASKDYSLRWSHSQDPKANPTRTFSANVNISSTSYNKNNSTSMSSYLNNTQSSSISYSKKWPGSPFNFVASMNHSQNNRNKTVSLNFPKAALTMNRIYPLRSKKSTGEYKWYENISTGYTANFDNRINVYESSLFTPEVLDSMDMGFKHSIPVSTNFKVLNFLNISPSVTYNGVLYKESIRRYASGLASGASEVVTDTIRRMQYGHSVSPSISIGATPKIYGMFLSKRSESYIAAVRHVISPSASFSFVPDMRGIMPNYYDTVYTQSATDPDKINYEVYSYFEDRIFGTPSANGKSASLSLSLGNNLEMKVRPRNDTTGEMKKVAILENFNFSTSYQPFKDSIKWNDIGVTGGTKIFNKKVDLRFGSTLSPYAINEAGTKINKSYYSQTGKLARITRASINMGMSFRSGAAKGTEDETLPEDGMSAFNTDQEMEMLGEDPYYEPTSGYYYGDYVDFNIPWSFRMDYSWSYTKNIKKTITHSVRLSGDFSLTPKWKIGMNSGYDIVAHKITTTNINIHRDLHCWEMRFTMVPFGPRKSYSFTINAKSSLLRDLKLDKKGSWYDNF